MDLTKHLELLARTRVPTVIAAISAAHWLFGNLYEEIVTTPPALVRPQPGLLVSPLGLGSPVWYYGPTLPVAVAASWVVAARTGAEPSLRRRTRSAAVAVTVAAALKVALITKVNPNFRDPTSTTEQIRATTALWLVGNGAAILALAAGLHGLLRWRSIPDEPQPTDLATPKYTAAPRL